MREGVLGGRAWACCEGLRCWRWPPLCPTQCGARLGLATECFVVLLSHAYLWPYADWYCGWAETLFLCDLTLVAVLQIPQVTFATLGQRQQTQRRLQVTDGLGANLLRLCALAAVRVAAGPPPLEQGKCPASWQHRRARPQRTVDTGARASPPPRDRGAHHSPSAAGTVQEGEDVALVSATMASGTTKRGLCAR